MPMVFEKGKEEVAQLQKIKGNYMISSRIPIIKKGEIIGVSDSIMEAKTIVQKAAHTN